MAANLKDAFIDALKSKSLDETSDLNFQKSADETIQNEINKQDNLEYNHYPVIKKKRVTRKSIRVRQEHDKTPGPVIVSGSFYNDNEENFERIRRELSEKKYPTIFKILVACLFHPGYSSIDVMANDLGCDNPSIRTNSVIISKKIQEQPEYIGGLFNVRPGVRGIKKTLFSVIMDEVRHLSVADIFSVWKKEKTAEEVLFKEVHSEPKEEVKKHQDVSSIEESKTDPKKVKLSVQFNDAKISIELPISMCKVEII